MSTKFLGKVFFSVWGREICAGFILQQLTVTLSGVCVRVCVWSSGFYKTASSLEGDVEHLCLRLCCYRLLSQSYSAGTVLARPCSLDFHCFSAIDIRRTR